MFTLIFKIFVQRKIEILMEGSGTFGIYLVLLRVFVNPKSMDLRFWLSSEQLSICFPLVCVCTPLL